MEWNMLQKETETDQLFFIHIPKAAGTTFIGILDTRFAVNDICPVHWPYEKLVKEISDEYLAKYKFIRGHFPFALVERLTQMPVCITMLREPVVRFISEYEQLQKEPLHHLHNEIKQLTLAECLKRPHLSAYMANKATRYLGGEPTNAPLWEQKPNLELAIERLERLAFVGVAEHFSSSLKMFCDTFNFPSIGEYETKNVSPDRGRRKEISEKILDQIAELNREDIALYDYGVRLFQKRLADINEHLNKRTTYQSDEIHFDFRVVPPGVGWYVGEWHPVHGYIRWSGPNRISSLRFDLKRGVDFKFRFKVVNAVSKDVLESLLVRVNETPITLVRSNAEEPGMYFFESMLPSHVIDKNDTSTQFDFYVDRTISPDETDAFNTDRRSLGICYNWIDILPVNKVTQ